MADPTSLLSTLAQAAAVFVAIVGGFLVSRLVAISTERDGLRRRRNQTLDELRHVADAYRETHEYRLHNSQAVFRDWVLDRLVAREPVDREAFLADHIPRGSSRDEMRPYFDYVLKRAQEISEEIKPIVAADDSSHLVLEDLESRGLTVQDAERDFYSRIVDMVAAGLDPPPASPWALAAIPPLRAIVDPVTRSTDARRLDESIRDEQELHARKRILEAECSRLAVEFSAAGRLVGVLPAIGILAAYSLLGIVAPVVVLALDPSHLSA